MIQGEWKSRKR